MILVSLGWSTHKWFSGTVLGCKAVSPVQGMTILCREIAGVQRRAHSD